MSTSRSSTPDLHPRWDDTSVTEATLTDALAESPDGLLHAGLSANAEAFCELDGPTLSGGPDVRYVRLNLDAGSTPEQRAGVTCPGCREWMHA